MFDASDFRKIIDETAALIERLRTAPEEEVDELQLRRDSNIQALEIIGGQIQDPELRSQAERIIGEMSRTLAFEEETVTARLRRCPAEKKNELVDEELLKGAEQLKGAFVRFGESLKTDKRVLEGVSGKMAQNSEGSAASLKRLTENEGEVKMSTLLYLSVILFVLVYFVIKLF